MKAPFSVLYVCMGNICRSPMGERLLARAAAEAFGDRADEVLYVHSAGTGGWHAGESMNPPAAREIRRRGGRTDGFAARRLLAEHLDASDLVLTATTEQSDFVRELRPDAVERTFVVGEFARLLRKVDRRALPGAGTGVQPARLDADAVYDRATALVEAADALRAGTPAEPGDELDDPWGLSQREFTRIADEIEDSIGPFIELLTTG